MERVNDTVIKVQERLSDCARRVSRMMQHEWEEKERWAGVNCGRRKLWVSAVVFLHLPCHQQTKKLNPRRASSFKSRDVKELRFNASTSELRRVSSRISPRSVKSELLQSIRVANPPQLEEI